MSNEVEEIKEELKHKCLLQQDELFKQFNKHKQEWESNEKAMVQKIKD